MTTPELHASLERAVRALQAMPADVRHWPGGYIELKEPTMTKPNDVSQADWDAACAAHDKMPKHGLQMRHYRIASIARAIEAEREACALMAEEWSKEGEGIANAIRNRSDR